MSLDGLEPQVHLAELDPSQDLMGRHKRMSRTARLLFLLLLSLGAATLLANSGLIVFPATGQAQSLRPVAAASPDIPFDDGEFESERQLLALANQSRRAAGVPPLTLDSGLSRAARIHAQTMLESRQLSHQLQNEPALPQRLASSSRLLLDQEGENVALDYDALHGHEHLMLSPPHRANLLNPAYNVVGLGVVRNGDRLYIVQDFGHALPNYSSSDVKERVALAIEHKRRAFNRGQLAHRDLPGADEAACSMAQSDRLSTSKVRNLAERYTVLTYSSVHPDAIPKQAFHALSSRNLRTFSVGTCYARSETYPSGAYWIVLSLD
ncbi:MAG TPA: CAP domain-containing protein [Candidatus Sulfotelmatobacter sp.]